MRTDRCHPQIVQQIKEAAYLPYIVNKYTRLDRHLKGLCPFHQERHPSFSISPKKNIWHCFGCGAGGDVFSFIMRAENVTFPDAVKLLAFEAGIRLPQAATVKRAIADEWQRIQERLEELGYIEYLFKKVENSIYGCLRFRLLSLLPREDITARDYTEELIIMEDFDQIDVLVQKRKNLFDEMRKEVRSGKSF